MERPVRKYPMLTLATILVAMGLLIDGLVILRHAPQALEFILFADIPIFMGLTLDLYFVLRGRKPKEGIPTAMPKVNQLVVVENKDSTSDTYPEITAEAFQSTVIEEPSFHPEQEYQIPLPPKKMMDLSESPKLKLAYSRSPERMNLPAFLCSCGHPHRFVCLACGMTVEKALNAKGTRWVEWLPEMGSRP